MTTFPGLTGRRVMSALRKAGFQLVPGLLAKILRDCELTRKDLQKLV